MDDPVNMIENEPDGLGEHIKVYSDYIFTDAVIDECLNNGDLCLYILYYRYLYAVIIGSNIINADLDLNIKLDKVQEILDKVKTPYLDKAWDYLEMYKEHIHYLPIYKTF